MSRSIRTLNTAEKILEDISSSEPLDTDQAIRVAEALTAAAAVRATQEQSDALGAIAAALNRTGNLPRTDTNRTRV